ncbi:hypothetical protein CUS_6330 [Ruminococcus albus 8]|uniref:Uncharacterized protein n=1 Tax=Ruminococcus albus 8 TaxID=246199 RepID=E9SGB1_RUMAL|nr:hypothetical protein CUS_6330 [Ruminococcus albus 8]
MLCGIHTLRILWRDILKFTPLSLTCQIKNSIIEKADIFRKRFCRPDAAGAKLIS